eukprot:COSAG01_NODE_31636_length_594_cov_0.789899_1_plen_29_part_01
MCTGTCTCSIRIYAVSATTAVHVHVLNSA